MRKIELLTPARDAEIGKAAFLHGADAVYIGAPKFSARAAAGNDIKDIEDLASYGHLYGAKTFVAFNTLLKDSELEDAERMAWQLYEAGVDALIIQDLGLLKLNLPPIELHASTQTDNRTIEKVRLMRDLGMTRVVLARELSVEQIRAIREAVPDVELECFVHGALCVGVSGQCYLSAAIANRSANRGVCAQPCRLPMTLLNARGETVVKDKHLLSLRDMNRSALLEELIAAGVTSLKIEGRLKDLSYVKNVTAYYRRELDRILAQHPDWQPLSDGKTSFSFEPALEKSFNRGFTEYQKDREGYWNFETPKSVGEYLGKVKSVGRSSLIMDCREEINNGDGLMVGNVGFRANKVEGKEVRPLDLAVLKDIRPGMEVWRNLNHKFEQNLERNSAKRKLPVDVLFSHDASFAALSLSDGTSSVEVRRGPFPVKEKPVDYDPYVGNLTKFGDSVFELRCYKYEPAETCTENNIKLHIPASELNEMRREAVSLLLEKRMAEEERRRKAFARPDYVGNARQLDANGVIPTDFRANAMNRLAKEILAEMKLCGVADAFENQPSASHPVMLTRHCLKFALGQCPQMLEHSAALKDKFYQAAIKDKFSQAALKDKWKEPMSLLVGNKKFRLQFGCGKGCYTEILM